LRPSSKALLRNFEDPAMVDRLLALPAKIWAKAMRQRGSPRKAMVTAQKAIMIEFLLHAPLRLKNFAALSFDKHMSWPSDPRGPILLHIEAGETKNGREYCAELGEPLAGMLRLYREVLVPEALGRSCDRLCVTVTGAAKTHGCIEQQFKRTIHDHLGIDMSPHKMRHVMAKVYLDENPGGIEVVREMLGHSSTRTTRENYAPVDTKRAVRHHDQVIARLRAAARVKPKFHRKPSSPRKPNPEKRR
jgi:site-specific recombinase XerC